MLFRSHELGGSSLFFRLEEIDPFALGVGATHSSSDEMRT